MTPAAVLPIPQPRLGLPAALARIDAELGASPYRRAYRAAACLNHGDADGLRRELAAGLGEGARLHGLGHGAELVLPAAVALALVPVPLN